MLRCGAQKACGRPLRIGGDVVWGDSFQRDVLFVCVDVGRRLFPHPLMCRAIMEMVGAPRVVSSGWEPEAGSRGFSPLLFLVKVTDSYDFTQKLIFLCAI